FLLAGWTLELDDTDMLGVAGAYVGVWIAAEASLAAAVGWHLSWRSPLLWLLREALLPVLLIHAWLGKSLSWRGNELTSDRSDVDLRTGALRW
ncbi:MAG TPA: hypothetical protein VFY92_05790, partial [Hyphomicrobiaceae bacterium]|nr:hypothetical protein [Hyphomicrobiaceae bacterium]